MLIDERFKSGKAVIGIIFSLSFLLTTGCAMKPPMKTVDYVDIPRFMGDWYVVANIPTPIERGAHNAVEHYALNDDGTIATTFTFRKNSFTGPKKEYHPKGFIRNTQTNALWGMQFIWPFKGDFRIVYLADDYSETVIARKARDYVWIMKRTPEFSAAEFGTMKDFINKLGYDAQKLSRVPQRWTEQSEAGQ